MRNQDVYKDPFTLNMPGAIVRVYVPVLTEEEQKRRMQAIYTATENLFKYRKGVSDE